MDEFNEQLRKKSLKDISEFNTNPNYANIRELYRQNFETILSYIEKFGHKSSIEDISRLDGKLSKNVLEQMHLLMEINKAISTGQLKKSDIK